MNLIAKIIIKFLLLLITGYLAYSQQEKDINDFKPKPEFRFMRIYGGSDETKPPIVIINQGKSKYSIPIGENSITIEFDILANVPPNLYAKFIHCSVDWKENDNVFLNDIIYQRTSNISWESAPSFSKFYSHRGKLSVPNEQVKFQFSGNWKVKLFEYGDDTTCFAEGRFFVVTPKADCSLSLISDLYFPKYNVSSNSNNIEAQVQSQETLLDNNANTVIIYRNNRWNEPYVITERNDMDSNPKLYLYKHPTMIAGFLGTTKLFRVEGIPSENVYRVISLTDLATYPRISGSVRLPFSDLRRNGSYSEYDDDGAMTSTFVTSSIDEYIYLEFVLNPEGRIAKNDVFIAGSFNNWKPDASWQMHYDEEDHYYHLRQWIRRAKHNYLYTSGRYNYESKCIEKYSTDQYEGNTNYSGHTYIALIYYREIDYGGYDSIIGIGAVNSSGGTLR